MRILVSGGTGFLGSALVRELQGRGDLVTVISRHPKAGNEIALDQLSDPYDAVVNLAGESVDGRWTAAKKDAIYHSRIDATRILAEFVERTKPTVFLSASAIGIYGDTADQSTTESAETANVPGFLAKVCRDWEQAANAAAWNGVRTVNLRTGHVLDPSGGLLGRILPIMRRFPIVRIAPKNAYLSWIARDDWVRLVLWALDGGVEGPVNLTAPTPETQETFTQAIAELLHKRVWGTVPKVALKLMYGEFADSICQSQRIVPARALSQGFAFGSGDLRPYLQASVQCRDQNLA